MEGEHPMLSLKYCYPLYVINYIIPGYYTTLVLRGRSKFPVLIFPYYIYLKICCLKIKIFI